MRPPNKARLELDRSPLLPPGQPGTAETSVGKEERNERGGERVCH